MTHWSTGRLAKPATLIRGVSFDKSQAVTSPRAGYLPVLRAGNIQESLLIDRDLIHVPPELVANEQRMRRGDVAICMSSGSAAVLGKTAQLDSEWSGSVGA